MKSARIKANKKYSQTVKQAFHLSAAALDTSQVSGNEDVQVLLTSDNNVFLLCTLNKERTPQFSLDLNFAEGDEICFAINGNGIVHLTGFLVPEDDLLDDMEEEELNEVFGNKQKAGAKPEAKANKKIEKKQSQKADEEDDSDDEEDESFNLEDAKAESDDDDEEADSDEEAEGGEEEDSDDDDDDNNDEEGEDDSDDEEDEETTKQPAKKKAKLDAKPKQNGLDNGQASIKEKKKDKKEGGAEKQQPGAVKTLPGGIQVTDLKVGNGPEAKPGKKVVVYYEGRLKQNNKVFENCK